MSWDGLAGWLVGWDGLAGMSELDGWSWMGGA